MLSKRKSTIKDKKNGNKMLPIITIKRGGEPFEKPLSFED